jgi:ligand-binding sensor domain-containing protein/two-component sensor histidine kinase
MWIATQDGLNRFDSKDIIIYNKSAGEKHLLLGSDITDMVEDTSRNILWVISSLGGLNGINLKTGAVQYVFSVADSANRFPDPWLKTLIQNGDELWIGTDNGIAIYQIREQRFRVPGLLPIQNNNNNKGRFDVNLFFNDEFGRIWAFTNFGIVIYSVRDYSIISIHPLTELGLPEDYFNKRFNSCKHVAPGQILLATHKGIKRIKYNQNEKISIDEERIPGAYSKAIRFLNLDRDGNMWFATDEGLYKKNLVDGSFAYVEDVNLVDQKKWTNSVNTIYFDRNKNLWLGTLQGFAIATKTKNTAFLSFFQSADLKTKINRANFIFPFNYSTEYVCAEEGFYHVENPGKKIKRLKEGVFWLMFRHKDGNLFLSTDNRYFVFRPPDQFIAVEKIYPELFSISHETINSAVNWNDSLQYLGSEEGNGVYEWNYKKKTLTKLDSRSSNPLKDKIVNAIYKDKLNRIWVLSDNSFAVYNPADNKLENHELTHPATGLPLNLFFDVCEASGSYWLASYGSGIIQLDDQFRIKNIISTSQGMNNGGVYKLFPVDDSLLFSTSNNGLSKINTRNFSVSNYFEIDGLHSNAFEEHCGTTYNGEIYAGGPDGFTIIDPKYISPNTNPPDLYISNIVIVTKTGPQEIADLFLKSARLSRDLLQATVYFSALNYSNPERTTYAYRIKGQQDEWINLGKQNFVNLIGLKPDTYTLQVRAFNEDGLPSEIKEIQLIFLPKWFQTWWFKVLLALLGGAIFYTLYRIRINQLNKEKEIRSHLASDLHDDLGSTLNSVKVYANMAMIEKDNPQHLEKIKESAQQAIAGVRDIIWVLDDKKDNLDHLLTRISQFAGPLSEADHISFRQEVDESLYGYILGKEEKRNLYMIMKEAINNSIKYAGCKKIQLTISKSDGKLTITITDDGTGFNKEKITEGSGLKNIMNRSKEIGYEASINTLPGKGTTLHLKKI